MQEDLCLNTGGAMLLHKCFHIAAQSSVIVFCNKASQHTGMYARLPPRLPNLREVCEATAVQSNSSVTACCHGAHETLQTSDLRCETGRASRPSGQYDSQAMQCGANRYIRSNGSTVSRVNQVCFFGQVSLVIREDCKSRCIVVEVGE